MKYSKWSKERILKGKKSLTSRQKPHYDSEVRYITGPLPLWFIKKYLYKDEGADSPEELQKVINQIFRRKVDDKKLFYVHVLKRKAVLRKLEMQHD